MFAVVDWYDRKGEHRTHRIEKACDLNSVLSLIERQGGRVRKYATHRRVG